MTRPIREQAADLCSAMACSCGTTYWVDTADNFSRRARQLATDMWGAVVRDGLRLDSRERWAEAECRLREGES